MGLGHTCVGLPTSILVCAAGFYRDPTCAHLTPEKKDCESLSDEGPGTYPHSLFSHCGGLSKAANVRNSECTTLLLRAAVWMTDVSPLFR